MTKSLLIGIILVFFTAPFLSAQGSPVGVQVGPTMCDCPGMDKPLGNASSCEVACFGEPASGPTIDYEAQRRAQEAAAENQRRIEKEQQLEKERQAEIKRKKDADFIRDRDKTVNTLKGSLGNKTQLKGLSDSQSSELKGSNPALPGKLKSLLNSNAKVTPPPDSAAVRKTIAALDCAVKSILEEYNSTQDTTRALDTDSIQADLNSVKNIIRIPPTGKKDTYQIQNISFSHQSSANGKEKQIVGSLAVSRNEETGEVHIDVMQATTKDAGILSRIFGRKKSTKESQSLLIIDRDGVILDKEVPRSVKKCLKAR